MRRLLRHWAPIALLSLLLVLVTHAIPPAALTLAQGTATTAPVVLDGKVLFEIDSVGEAYPARSRAREVEARLRDEIARSGPPRDLVVAAGNCPPDEFGRGASRSPALEDSPAPQQWVLCPRGEQKNLLTVTPADASLGESPRQQAEDWKSIVETALERAYNQRQPEYLRRAVLVSLGWVALAWATGAAVGIGANVLRRHIEQRREQPDSVWHSWHEPAGLALKGGTLLLQGGILLGAVYAIVGRFPLLRQWRYNLWTWLNDPNIALGTTRNYSTLQLVALVALSAGLWVVVGSATQLLKESVLRRSRMPVATQEVLAFFLRYILVFLGVLVLFQLWGIDLRSLTLLASVLGVGIGFGVQNIANNFISGLIVAIERPIQVGDFVRVGEWTGTVKQIGARHTTLSTLDRVSVIVPNSRFLEEEVINWSHGDTTSRLHVPVGVAYGSDVMQVRTALLEAATGHSEVLLRPHPQVWFQEFGESALQFELLVWIAAPQEMPRIKSDLNFRIARSLRRRGIKVPFPQRDVNLRAPLLDRAIAVWLSQTAPHLATELEKPSEARIEQEDPSVPNLRAEDPDGDSRPELDLEVVAAAMRGIDGVSICSRRYRLQLYRACFIGHDAVDWLVQQYDISRPEAVEIGQSMLERGIIHHVLDQHQFADSHLFYRFYSDELKLRQGR